MHKFYCHHSELDNEHVTMRCVDFNVPIAEGVVSGYVEFINSFEVYNTLLAIQATQQDTLANGDLKTRIEAKAKLQVIDDIIKSLDFN